MFLDVFLPGWWKIPGLKPAPPPARQPGHPFPGAETDRFPHLPLGLRTLPALLSPESSSHFYCVIKPGSFLDWVGKKTWKLSNVYFSGLETDLVAWRDNEDRVWEH